MIKVYNKIDQADIDLSGNPGNKDTVYVSAIDGSGIDELTAKLSDWVDLSLSEIRLRIPQTRQDIITSIYKNADVTDRNYEGNDIVLMCRMTSDLSLKYQEYEIS